MEWPPDTVIYKLSKSGNSIKITDKLKNSERYTVIKNKNEIELDIDGNNKFCILKRENRLKF